MACCPSHTTSKQDFVWHAPEPAEATSTPAWSASFTTANVKANLPDGYWIEAFPFRTKPAADEGPVGPEIIAYGLGVMGDDDKPIPSEVKMYLNPFNQMKNQTMLPNEWQSTTIQTLDFPVAATHGNFRPESGLNDVIICHDYGPSMDNLNEEGGIVSYLKNPGDKKKKNWERREIGKSIAMHRLKTGYFTQKEHLEIIALPIMTKSKDRESPAPVIIYKPIEWDDDKTPKKWEAMEPEGLQGKFRLIHDVEIIHAKADSNELDKALVAGREGISLIWMDNSEWEVRKVGAGIPQSREPFKNPYWGSGSVAPARTKDDHVGYIASCEAFHGNLVSVYVKPSGANLGDITPDKPWRRFVIDDFGPLKPGEFTGTIHHVQCADLDGSGEDSIIVACMGYPDGKLENIGTYVYKPVDLSSGLFSRHKISNASAGRIAIADYRCSGALDVATVSYSVPNYLVTDDPAVRVMLNNTKQTRRTIKAEKVRVKGGHEVKLSVPRAAVTDHTSEMPFLDIAGKVLSVVVLPPYKEYLLGEVFSYQEMNYQKDGVKVINGELSWTTTNNTKVTRTIAVAEKTSESMIPDTPTRIVKAGKDGAIFIRFASSITTSLPGMKFSNMKQATTVNTLPFSASHAARNMEFPWVKVNDLKWAKKHFDWEFHNLIGYQVAYNDGKENPDICHIQAWTLAAGETAAFHNHKKDLFCEIHACISNGTGKGGMYWAKDKIADDHFEDKKNRAEKRPEELKKYAEMIVVNEMEEHGALWRTETNGEPKLNLDGNKLKSVSYPYHAWIAGPKLAPHTPQPYDIWLAFEFHPHHFMKPTSS